MPKKKATKKKATKKKEKKQDKGKRGAPMGKPKNGNTA